MRPLWILFVLKLGLGTVQWHGPRNSPLNGGHGKLEQILVENPISEWRARPRIVNRLPPCWRSMAIIGGSGGSTKSSICKQHTASILANVFDSIEINTERAFESPCGYRIRVPAPLTLTGQQQSVRQRGEAGHQEWTEHRMET